MEPVASIQTSTIVSGAWLISNVSQRIEISAPLGELIAVVGKLKARGAYIIGVVTLCAQNVILGEQEVWIGQMS